MCLYSNDNDFTVVIATIRWVWSWNHVCTLLNKNIFFDLNRIIIINIPERMRFFSDGLRFYKNICLIPFANVCYNSSVLIHDFLFNPHDVLFQKKFRDRIRRETIFLLDTSVPLNVYRTKENRTQTPLIINDIVCFWRYPQSNQTRSVRW